MYAVAKKGMWVLVAIAALSILTGCTNWKKKYQGLNVEHQNLKGLYESTAQERAALAQQLAQEKSLVDELQRQIAEGKKTPAQATGFEGFDTKFDANAGTITVTLQDLILFDAGKADLKKSNPLKEIYSVINEKYAGKVVDVVGHTDSDPIKKSKWKDNWELSSQRALAVTRDFVKMGMNPQDVRAVGRGESMPVASNKTSAGKAKNRRVEIVVHLISDEAKAAAAATNGTSEEEPK